MSLHLGIVAIFFQWLYILFFSFIHYTLKFRKLNPGGMVWRTGSQILHLPEGHESLSETKTSRSPLPLLDVHGIKL